jgi:hypothetical protein
MRVVACDPVPTNVAATRARGVGGLEAIDDAWPLLSAVATCAPFDTIASNFGALNAAVCAGDGEPWRDRLRVVIARTAALMKPGGRLVLSVIAPLPLLDLLQATLRGDLRFVARRATQRPLVRALDGHELAPSATVPLTANDVIRAAGRVCRVSEVWGYGLGVSPAIAQRYARVPLLGGLLGRLAGAARAGWLAAAVADHAVVVLERRADLATRDRPHTE